MMFAFEILDDIPILEQEKEWKEDCKRQVMTAFARAEKKLKPNWKEIFTDVYDEMPSHIRYVANFKNKIRMPVMKRYNALLLFHIML